MKKRALDAVAQCLIRHLMGPNIDFEEDWSKGADIKADLLAIDRAGTRDAHTVELKFSAAVFKEVAPQLQRIPAQFRWFAYFRESAEANSPWRDGPTHDRYAEAAGRIGIIEVIRKTGDNLTAQILIKAERFHIPRAANLADYVARHPAHIAFE